MQTLQHVAATYDSLAEEYDRRYLAAEAPPRFRLFLSLYDQLTWRYIEPYLPTDRSAPILDAGGGSGKWALRIARQGYRDVRLIDLSAEMLNQAEQRFAAAGLADVLTLQVGDIRDLPWPEGAFGFVLSEGDPVGYCLSDYPLAICELVRVCAPGGLVIVAVDDLLAHYLAALQMESQEAALALREARTSQCPYELPVRCFTPRELRETFDAAGADVLKILNKPALTHLLRSEARQKFLEDPALQQALFEADIWACEEGYVTGGSHLQVVACKRNGTSGG